jgi:hypothetical protein
MPTMLWKYGAVRMPPFHHASNCTREIAPLLPSWSKAPAHGVAHEC